MPCGGLSWHRGKTGSGLWLQVGTGSWEVAGRGRGAAKGGLRLPVSRPGGRGTPWAARGRLGPSSREAGAGGAQGGAGPIGAGRGGPGADTEAAGEPRERLPVLDEV